MAEDIKAKDNVNHDDAGQLYDYHAAVAADEAYAMLPLHDDDDDNDDNMMMIMILLLLMIMMMLLLMMMLMKLMMGYHLPKQRLNQDHPFPLSPDIHAFMTGTMMMMKMMLTMG